MTCGLIIPLRYEISLIISYFGFFRAFIILLDQWNTMLRIGIRKTVNKANKP